MISSSEYENLISGINEVIKAQNAYQNAEVKLDSLLEKVSEMKILQIHFGGKIEQIEERVNKHSSRQEKFEEKIEKSISEIKEVQHEDRLDTMKKMHDEINLIKDDLTGVKIKSAGISATIAFAMLTIKQFLIK